MLDQLHDENLRTVALLKLQGYNNGEIAQQLDITRRSVERKLQRIRGLWEAGSES